MTKEAVDHFEEDERRARRVDIDAIAEHGLGEFGVTVEFAKRDGVLAALHEVRLGISRKHE